MTAVVFACSGDSVAAAWEQIPGFVGRWIITPADRPVTRVLARQVLDAMDAALETDV